MQRDRKDPRKIYIAVKYIPRTSPEISWTKGEIANRIKVHRNSLVFKDGVANVRGWLIYQMEIEPTISTLRRKRS